jgi:hypothetical protein
VFNRRREQTLADTVDAAPAQNEEKQYVILSILQFIPIYKEWIVKGRR